MVFFFFLLCPLFLDGCDGAARDFAATFDGLPSYPSFCLGKVPSDFIQDPQILGRLTGLFPFALAGNLVRGVFFKVFLLTLSNHLSKDLSTQTSNGSMFRDFQITLSNSVTSSILCKNLISDFWIRDCTLLGHYPRFMTIGENRHKKCFEN